MYTLRQSFTSSTLFNHCNNKYTTSKVQLFILENL